MFDLQVSNPPLWVGSNAVYKSSQYYLDKFTVTSKFGDEIKLYKEFDGLVYLPRACCPIPPDDRRSLGVSVVFKKEPVPRANQVEVFNSVKTAILSGKSGVVSAYTAFGKTVLGYYAASVLQKKTLVITTKDDIYRQWKDGASKFLGLTPSEIGEIKGPKCARSSTKFVVAMLQSLSKVGKYPELDVSEFGLVIFDEVHRLSAPHFSAVVDMFPAKIRLGLSATVNRSDGKEFLFAAHIGPIIAETVLEERIPKVIRLCSKWECPRVSRLNKEAGVVEYVPIHHTMGQTRHVEKILAIDPSRNHLICSAINDSYRKGRKILVFSTLHNHLESLARMCISDFDIPSKDIGFYIGATTKASREKRDKCKTRPILFTTYSMAGEGTSIDWLDTCLLAMPIARPIQPIGRIRRMYPDKKDPVVIDIVDNGSSVFSVYAKSRLKHYSGIGCVIKDIKE